MSQTGGAKQQLVKVQHCWRFLLHNTRQTLSEMHFSGSVCVFPQDSGQMHVFCVWFHQKTLTKEL